jgi:hypothetical protein
LISINPEQIHTDGYVFPLDIVSGLPYLKMRPFTDSEWHTLPHVILTSDADWDPSVLDQLISDTDDWYNSIPDKVGCTRQDTF